MAIDAELMRARLRARLFGVTEAPVTLGRFVVRERIGQGGMGVVYRAHDPELDRDVALKLVRGDHGDAGRQRLLREARALARLGHPNIVTVHDVGTVGDDVFVAMELCRGPTVEAWLAEAPRSTRAIVDVYVAAGRGLAFAHRHGVVHRDFKPQNVMLDDERGVRVLDFGLAVSSGDAEPGAAGTPAYMAAEQIRGRGADARSDQFAFCVALYEALYGERPFRGDTSAALFEAVLAGAVQPPPARTTVPAWLRAVLVRGLASDPDRRHPSMDALLAALSTDPVARRRRVLTAVGLACLFVAVGGYALREALRSPPSAVAGCQAAADVTAVWSGDRRAAFTAALTRDASPAVSDTAERTAAALDRYAASWIGAHQAACEATHVQRTQSPALLDLRLICLRRRLAELDAVVATFSEPRAADAAAAGVADAALRAARALGEAADCADSERLVRAQPLPHDPQVRAQIEALYQRLARVKALDKASRYREALAEVDALLVAARPLEFGPLVAEALYHRADMLDSNGDSAASLVAVDEAIRVAAESREDVIAAAAWVVKLWVLGYEEERTDEALAQRVAAEAAVARAGKPPRHHGSMEYTIGWIFAARGDVPAALARFESAIGIWTAAFGPGDEGVAKVEASKANFLVDLGRGDEAVAAAERSLATMIEVYGAGSLREARARQTLSEVLRHLGRPAEALPHMERALALSEAQYGADHPRVAPSMSNLGGVLTQLGRHDEAIAVRARALAVVERAHGPDDPRVAFQLNELGASLAATGAHARTEAVHRRALAIRERLGADSLDTAISLHNLVAPLAGQGKHAEALAAAERALAIFERRLGGEHVYVARALDAIGDAYLAMGRPRDAVAPLDRGLAILERMQQVDPTLVAELRSARARARAR